MHFIVTGGAGFIGSHVTEQLLADGHTVTVVDNLRTGTLQNLRDHPNLRIVCRDVLACQPQDFVEPVDGIAHLAARPSVVESWVKPLETHEGNLTAMLRVIQLCKALRVPRLVFASSAAVYGSQSQLPISEKSECYPISPYGLHKRVSEQYASLFAPDANFSFISLRLFNAFGPRQSPGSPYSGVITTFAAAMQQNLPITIYGDGSQTRDFIYVGDVALGFAKALGVPLATGSSLIANLGTGQATSLLDLVRILHAGFPNWKPVVKFEGARSGDILHSQADISLASTLLNFTPQWTIAEGIQQFTYSLVDR
ncbi:MAG: NAD-dependent epimerase/dehydratase family protein [Leptolyngbyaceae cyanobacterium bins.59]|nr:NAD-dependent epimerase/dehydratase family protein [Leptolyngbyaceae cyanobacterium bins.59]